MKSHLCTPGRHAADDAIAPRSLKRRYVLAIFELQEPGGAIIESIRSFFSTL
jgi:hypothetical protein